MLFADKKVDRYVWGAYNDRTVLWNGTQQGGKESIDLFSGCYVYVHSKKTSQYPWHIIVAQLWAPVFERTWGRHVMLLLPTIFQMCEKLSVTNKDRTKPVNDLDPISATLTFLNNLEIISLQR